MHEKEILGKRFEFDNQYFQKPKKFGSLNLFQLGDLCCECGYEVAPHIQVCHEISCVISGEGLFLINGQGFPVKEGDVVISQKGDLHEIHASRQTNLRYYYLGFASDPQEGDSMSQVTAFFSNPLEKRIEHDTFDISGHFLKVINELYNPSAFSDEMIHHYLIQILVLTYRTMIGAGQKRMPAFRNANSVGSTVYSVVKYIDNNIFNIDSIGNIAKSLGYSKEYLSHLFHAKTGMTLQHYINCKKIEKSLELMETERLNITQIALMLRYDSVQSFSKAFKRTLGFSPVNYEKQMEKS